jgi:hypothetical protein
VIDTHAAPTLRAPQKTKLKSRFELAIDPKESELKLSAATVPKGDT